MKIRKLAAVLAVPLLMAAETAMAEGPMPPAMGYGIGDRTPLFPGVGPVLGDGTGTAAPLGEALSKAGAVPVSEMGEVFLNHAALPKDVHYEPLARGDSVFARHMGTMTVKGKKYTAGALVVGADFKGKASDDFFGGMFLPKGHSPEAGARMLAFNVALLKLESTMNEVFLHAVDEVRRDTGEKLPYDFLTVDMVHVEQLHSLKGNPKTYSFSIRPVFSADGWMVPLFIRGFAAKVDGSYRFLFLAAPDSERDMVERAGLDLIRRPMMKEVKK